MAHLKKSATNGHLLKNATGHLINECGGNPCDPDPEMLCTVTGASGTINWCGETWNLPADSGVQKSVCPTGYTKGQNSTGFTSPPPANKLYATHRWRYSGGISMTRLYQWRYWTFMAYLSQRNWVNNLKLFGTATDAIFFQGGGGSKARPPTVASTNVAKSTIGLITTVGAPFFTAYGGYALTSNFFGSYTTGGITYSWQQGAGW